MKLFLSILALMVVFVPTKAKADFIDYPTVKLQALDKSTARTITFEAKVGSTIEYGSVFIKVKACRKSEPLDKPESASFLQVWEVPINSDKSEWIFSGWMFASSPALSAMNHPVYDVWVLGCLDKDKASKQVASSKPDEEDADKEDLMTVEMDASATAAAAQQKSIQDIVDETAQPDNDDEEMIIEVENIDDSEAEIDEDVSFEE